MSVARTSKCLFCTFRQSSKRAEPVVRRQFHLSPVRSKPRKQSSPNQEKNLPETIKKTKGPLDKVEILSEEAITNNYTPEQAEAIRATQTKLKKSFEDLTVNTTQNNKPWTMDYMQKMTEIDPVVDKPVRAPWSNLDDSSRLKTEDELNEDIYNFMQSMPDDDKQAAEAFQKFLAENRITVGKPEAEFNPRSATAPDVPTMKKEDFRPNASFEPQSSEESSTRSVAQSGKKSNKGLGGSPRDQEISPALVRLMQMTGFSQQQLASLRVKSIISHRVVNQTRLGKIQKQYWLSVAGNQNGLLGIGEGKSEEAAEGMIQSQYRAIRNMQPVMRYENRTIFGDVEGKSGATELALYARPPGFGLRCQQYIWEMCRCAGITDLAARVTRARNPMNTVKAAFQALQSQKDPEEVARGRGKKLVDVRKVYYAGNV